jgi:isovaleryl-CoA dehydrogenase
MTYLEDLEKIVSDDVTPAAAEVDRVGTFPKTGIQALQAAGLLAAPVAERFGGGGLGLSAASEIVRRLSVACSSTAMVVSMHYAATAVLAAVGREDVLREIGERRHLSTLAFSEAGSRSHFWAPVSSAVGDGDQVVLDASKSWEAEGPMTLWLVRSGTAGLSVSAGFDGLGLRGNDSCPVTAARVRVAESERLGADGAGLEVAMTAALPWFLLLNASASVGLMQALIATTASHLSGARLEHLGQSLAQQLPARTKLARMQIQADRTRALVREAVAAAESGRDDASLLALEAKAAADEASVSVSDLAISACGGAAFRKELDVERRFRDSRAAQVMAPTTDALLDFVGRALCGLPLLDA